MRKRAAVTVVMLLASPAFADLTAYQLGDVLGSEEACGLDFDQSAIERFITEHAPADDLGFVGDMNGAASVMRGEIPDFSESQKTAHCAQIRRVARNFGLIN